MLFSDSLQILVTERHADLLREAATERLARQVSRQPLRVRRRLAEVLYRLATRLDPSGMSAAIGSNA